MTLISKIPPLISALAFGYGVGMAAPESTLTSARAAVDAYQHAAPRHTAQVTAGAFTPMPAGTFGRGGSARENESRELSRLRATAARDGRGEHASCELDRPTHSRPRYESRRDVEVEVEDVDDLDDAGTQALSRLQLPDLKIPITKRTLKYVRFFTRSDRGRGMFETWLKRSGRYQDLIQMELRERRLPEDLIWVAMIESGFDARAKSPAGAVGLWQFMPATGKVYGLQQGRHLDQRKNPRLATQAAAHHLRDLYMRFGTWDLALAAYNMGYEQLLDRIDTYGTSDFNELARQQAIPSETASYVPKIAAAAIVANNLERFGFDKVDPVRPVDAAEIAVPPGTPLRTLAKAAGVSSATIRTLNPDMLGDNVPPGRGDFLLMVPADTLARAQASLPALVQTEVIVDDDAQVLDPVDLMGGQRELRRKVQSESDSLLSLLPPPKRRRALRDPLADLAVRDDGGDRDDEELFTTRRRRSSRETVMYKVGHGDTIVGIARQFAVDVDDVARDNKLDDGDKLKEGALLRLRVRRDVVDVPAASAAASGANGGDQPPGNEPLKERETDKAKARKDEPQEKPQRRREREAPELKPEKKDRGAEAPSRAGRPRRPS